MQAHLGVLLLALLLVVSSANVLGVVSTPAEEEAPRDGLEIVDPAAAAPSEEDAARNSTEASSGPLMETKGEELWSRLRPTWHASPVLQWSEHEFHAFAYEPTRPYALAVLFSHNTSGCHVAKADFASMARAYWKDLEQRRAVTSSRLYFVNIELSVAAGVFRTHKVSKVPSLVLIPALDGAILEGRALPAEWWRSHDDERRFRAWVQAQTGLAIPRDDSVSQDTMDGAIRIAFVAQLGLMVALNVRRLLKKKGWMYLTAIVYTVSVSGMIFCLLRGAPPIGLSRERGILFLYPDKYNQFLLEGLFVAALCVGTGAGLIFAFSFAMGEDVLGEWLQEPDSYARASPQQRRTGMDQNCVIALCMFYLGFLFMTLMFMHKAPWYHPLA
jgi:hypothetical protein